MVRKYAPLDNVRLTGSEILAPPTISTFEHLSTRPTGYEVGNSREQLSVIMEVQLEAIVDIKLEK